LLVLGIETSCDETSAAVVSGAGDVVEQRSLVILSQDVHRVFGGVVPEIASRAHVTAIVPVVNRALEEAAITLPDVDIVAVTNAPGLVGALLVGVSYAKGLAFGAGKPVLGVHHMEGHLFAQSLEHANAVPPFTALLVSGGHTLLVDVPAWGKYQVLGATRDDAAGEAFDKVAKLLGLPYPGGRHIERLARDGDPSRFRFARPMMRRNQQPGDDDYYDVSFSGLKTAVLHAVRDSDNIERDAPHIARGFQDALIETLAEKVRRAADQHDRQRVVLGGGVACNQALVAEVQNRLADLGADVYAPSVRLATDNAAMIARAGLFHAEQGQRDDWSLNAYASRPLGNSDQRTAISEKRLASD
jgi:N6-L-threonylcarbamoyladenine synthase